MINEEKIYLAIEQELLSYPDLRTALPQDYPHGKSYKITDSNLTAYNSCRAKKYWHQINLPLLILNLNFDREPKLKALCQSTLKTLNEFCREFNAKPGFRKTLEPLWADAWTSQPRFWSVIGETHLTLHLYRKNPNYQIVGFGMKIGSGKKDADVRSINQNGTVCHIDIESENLTKDIEGTPEDFRRLIEDRGRTKLEKKFPDLPQNEIGLAAQIYVVNGSNLDTFIKHKELTAPFNIETNKVAQVFWLVGATIDGIFGYHIVDKSVPQIIK